MESILLELSMDTPAKRIQILMAEADINQKELAKKLERSPPLISSYLSGAVDVPESFLLRVEKRLGWSSAWIQNGTGNKYTKDPSTRKPAPFTAPGTNRRPVVPDVEPLEIISENEIWKTWAGSAFHELSDGSYFMTVPLVEDYAYGGYLSGWNDREFVEELPKHTFNVSKRHTGKYRAFRNRGESMDDGTRDAICAGDIIVGRSIEKHLWYSKFHLHRFEDYIIVHKDGILTKRIYDHDVEQGIIYCRSLNQDKGLYPDFSISLADVYEIYNIVSVERKRGR
nr:helix-turn-helix transcriptional regulator [uncultured Arsenicibacter sp.]